MSNLPATQRKATIKSLLNRPDVKQQLQMALPSHVGMDRFIRVTTTTIMRNEKLLMCTPNSLLAALISCGQLGIEPDPATGLAYMIPFKNKGVYEAQLIIGYRGMLKLIRNSGELQSVSCQVVYENDEWFLQFGLEERLEHTPAEGDRGKPKGAYVIFRYKDGGHSFEYMSIHDIEKIRKRSKSSDSGPWVTDYAEMCKKTVIRRHAKLAPISIERLEHAVALENRHDSGQTQMDLMYREGATDVEPETIDVESEETQESGPGEVVEINKAAIEKFDKLMADRGLSGDANMEAFLALCAKRHDATTEVVKVSAVGKLDDFMKAFNGFVKKKAEDAKKQTAEEAATKKEEAAKKKAETVKKKEEAAKTKSQTEPAKKEDGGADPAQGEPVVECPLTPGEFVALTHCETQCMSNTDCETFKATAK